MSKQQIKPFGSWKSPITSDFIVSKSIGLGQIITDQDAVYWTESRPEEAGRNTLIQYKNNETKEITPAPFNVRTRAHEYGSGSFTAFQGNAYFSNFKDQQVYSVQNSKIEQLTHIDETRFADAFVDQERNQLICVCEDHRIPDQEESNSLISVCLTNGNITTLVKGNDFYSTPCLSPDGKQLAWLTWHHPNMPWDETELWVATFSEEGELLYPTKVAGGNQESIFQPRWSPKGDLYFVSDRSNWWNLYSWNGINVEPVVLMEAEFATPQWVFGMSTYAFVNENEIICTYTQNGLWSLASINIETNQLKKFTLPFNEYSSVQTSNGKAYFIAGSSNFPSSVIEFDPKTEKYKILRQSSEMTIPEGFLSVPLSVSCKTKDGQETYGFYYPPKNQDFQAPEGERPPLLVKTHGGPTAATSTIFNLSIQYWTSRGFGFLDVNYGGSTGYGRQYRDRLKKQWGIIDVSDTTELALSLAEEGKVDRQKLAIRGGSAGGYTTLCALTFHDVFKAGASHYGISELEALAKDTHKFEARYLDSLIGAYPEEQKLYQERSPIHYTEQLSCPVIIFQGLDDKVVPPNQAEMMYQALLEKGVPVAYVPFEGEQHGFRQAKNIKRALDGELYFYSKIFQFDLAEEIEPVDIKNLN